MRIALILALFAGAALAKGDGPLAPVYEKALDGDMKEGLRLLEAISPATLDAEQQKARDCMLATFRQPQPPSEKDPLLAGALAVYRDYWTQVLQKKEGDAILRDGLSKLLGVSRPIDELTDLLGKRLEAEGLHSIRGLTAPYQELMVWKKETAHDYTVKLPESTVKVRVVFMDDFASLGWEGFATCGRYHPAGWTKPEALYAVASAYDTKSEHFAVSYLAHEGQHFSDNAKFPKLEQPELEYRAKLTELATAKTTARDLLERFAAQQGPTRETPHGFANAAVVRDLGKPGSVAKINQTAAALLRASTKRLTALGASTVARDPHLN
jgi:hypothetical protein